ncbi:MAG: hypothetical protein RLZZ106_1696, partial [Cyanobacteriota bacterium]
MFLIDTNVISEARKGQRADPGVIAFWAEASVAQAPLFLPAVVVGELRRGVDLIRHRGDLLQAQRLERWLAEVLELYGDRVLALDQQIAA